jgi:hypothetical protein
MHLLHISWEFPPTIVGGLGTFTMELTRQLVVMGNEVTVYTLNRENKYPTRDNWKGVDVHRPMIVDFTHAFNIFAGEQLKKWGDLIEGPVPALTTRPAAKPKVKKAGTDKEEVMQIV